MLNYTKHMSTKLKQLIEFWPPKAIRAVSALKQLGYSQDLINSYRYSDWLKSVGEGAVILSRDEPSLYGAFYALQNDLQLKVHIGGLSALEMQGRGHYVKSGKQSVWIFGEVRKLPKWFTNYSWKEELHFTSSKFLDDYSTKGFTTWNEELLLVAISGDIRAILEFLSLVPKNESIEHAKDLMLGLSSVHPKQVTEALKSCKSVTAKRLFLLLAEECGHQWVSKINQSELYLGTGARNLFPGGTFNSKYQLTLPDTFSEVGGTK
jgi:hypothetical protein